MASSLGPPFKDFTFHCVHMHAYRCPRRPKVSFALGDGVTGDGDQFLYMYWEPNLGLLQEQEVLLLNKVVDERVGSVVESCGHAASSSPLLELPWKVWPLGNSADSWLLLANLFWFLSFHLVSWPSWPRKPYGI